MTGCPTQCFTPEDVVQMLEWWETADDYVKCRKTAAHTKSHVALAKPSFSRGLKTATSNLISTGMVKPRILLCCRHMFH